MRPTLPLLPLSRSLIDSADSLFLALQGTRPGQALLLRSSDEAIESDVYAPNLAFKLIGRLPQFNPDNVAIISADSDLLVNMSLQSCNTLYRYPLPHQSRGSAEDAQVFKLDQIYGLTNCTDQAELVAVVQGVGNDYTSGLPGIGVSSAVKLMQVRFFPSLFTFVTEFAHFLQAARSSLAPDSLTPLEKCGRLLASMPDSHIKTLEKSSAKSKQETGEKLLANRQIILAEFLASAAVAINLVHRSSSPHFIAPDSWKPNTLSVKRKNALAGKKEAALLLDPRTGSQILVHPPDWQDPEMHRALLLKFAKPASPISPTVFAKHLGSGPHSLDIPSISQTAPPLLSSPQWILSAQSSLNHHRLREALVNASLVDAAYHAHE